MRHACLIIVCATACATAPARDPASTENIRVSVAPQQTMDITHQQLIKEAVFTQPRAAVWQALLGAHEAFGLAAESADEAAGRASFVARDRSRVIAGKAASTWIDCGQGPAGARADSYRLTLRLSHQLDVVAGGIALKSVVDASARNPGMSSDPVPCSSTGRLEEAIASNMAVRLK
jgi:hypothetical protein